MPEISRFLGIIIYMYFNEHDPEHFHVRYNEHRAKISISNFLLIDGYLPARVFGLGLDLLENGQKYIKESYLTIGKL